MTEPRTKDPDPGTDPERTPDHAAKGSPADRPASDKDDDPWTREGADAPDAADIAEPDEQL